MQLWSTAILAGLCVLAAPEVRAGVLWEGDEAQGTKVFKLLNLEDGAQASVVADPTYGKVFQFHKPAGSNRCESSHCTGWVGKEGDLIYLGWRFKVQMPPNLTTNAVFQWHSYPTSQIQNYPIVVKTLSGKLWLEQYQPDGTRPIDGYAASEDYASVNVRNGLWSIPMQTETWHTVVLAIKISSQTWGGYVEWWYNGEQQSFRNGTKRWDCRTWDGDYSDPKWGVYGASGTEVTNYVTDLKIGTDYASVAPEGSVAIGRPLPARPLLFPPAAGRMHDLGGRWRGDPGGRLAPGLYITAP